MIVLLTGASGFLGRRIANRLRAAGHEVVPVVRDPSRLQAPAVADELDALPERCILGDFATDQSEEVWLPRLQGIDAVVNAAGIFRETPGQSFEAIHHRGPAALFRACARAGVRRVIQISALGADEAAPTAFLRSKWAADAELLRLPLDGLVLQPSLVFGPEGASTGLFLQLATLPLLTLPGGGDARVQPIHVDDLARGVARALVMPERVGRMAAVGPLCLPFRDYLAALRRSLGLGAGHSMALPPRLTTLVARFPRLSGGWLDRDALAMLAADNCAEAAPFTQLLGRPLRLPLEFIRAGEARPLVTEAQLGWLLPLLRYSIAIIWLVAGVVSLGLYPVTESLALLAATGITGWLGWVALYGAAAMDILFGIGTLVLKRRRRLWQAQLAVILLYTVVITVALPEFWLHPYGPLVKNLPIAAAILLLMALEERR